MLYAYPVTTVRDGTRYDNIVYAVSKADAHERMKLYPGERILSVSKNN